MWVRVYNLCPFELGGEGEGREDGIARHFEILDLVAVILFDCGSVLEFPARWDVRVVEWLMWRQELELVGWGVLLEVICERWD